MSTIEDSEMLEEVVGFPTAPVVGLDARDFPRDLAARVPPLRPPPVTVDVGLEGGKVCAAHERLAEEKGVELAVPSVAFRAFLMTAPLLVSDLLALLLCGLVGLLGIHLFKAGPIGGTGWAMPLALLPMVFAYWHGDLYPGIGIHPVVELRQITKLNTAGFLAVLFACLVTGSQTAWLVFFGCAWIASLPFVPISRALTRPGCAGQWWWGHPVLVISSGNGAGRIIKMMMRTPYSGLRPCGVVDPTAPRRGSVQGIPYLGHTAEVNALIRRHGIRHGVIALPDLPQPRVMEVLDRYRAQLPYLLVLSPSSDMPSLWGNSRACGGLGGMEIQNGLILGTPRFMKRIIDVALATACFLVGLPMLVLIALLVRLTSNGPIFYGHKRLGLGGKSFRAWKFRTMRLDADVVLCRLLDADAAARAEWERDFKLKSDPRITAFGRLLRKSSLDELPQLWNVLKGEMSLVGPRPIVDGEIEKYGRVFKLYTSVKPGITGLWQVSGRNETTYEQRVQLDNYYVRNWSPWLDIYILARTVKTMIRREGAY